jgi:hypothetical protein
MHIRSFGQVDKILNLKNKSLLIPAIIRKAEGSKLWQIKYIDIETRRPTGNFVSGMKSQQMRKPKAGEFSEEQDDEDVVMSFVNSNSSEEEQDVWQPEIEIQLGGNSQVGSVTVSVG